MMPLFNEGFFFMMAGRGRRGQSSLAGGGGRVSEYNSAGPRMRRAAHLGYAPGMGGLPRYLDLSRRPLQMLIFLGPLIALYAVGTWRYQTGAVASISAYERFNDFFEVFGVTWLYLPGAAIVVVLVVWHFLVRDRFEFHVGIPLVMWVEAWVLTIPLLVLSQILPRLETDASLLMPYFKVFQGMGASVIFAAPIAEYSWQAKSVLSIGAGLYEELLFRMVGIAAAHLILVDVFRLKDRMGTLLAILVAAVAFTFYHDLTLIDGSFDYQRAIFIFLSGLYFGGVFVLRGFGIVVGVHAIYDILVLVVLS